MHAVQYARTLLHCHAHFGAPHHATHAFLMRSPSRSVGEEGAAKAIATRVTKSHDARMLLLVLGVRQRRTAFMFGVGYIVFWGLGPSKQRSDRSTKQSLPLLWDRKARKLLVCSGIASTSLAPSFFVLGVRTVRVPGYCADGSSSSQPAFQTVCIVQAPSMKLHRRSGREGKSCGALVIGLGSSLHPRTACSCL